MTAEIVLTGRRAATRSADVGQPRRLRAAKLVRASLSLVASAAVALAGWQLFLIVFHVHSSIGRGPLDVWRYLFTSSKSAANRRILREASRTTLGHAMVGLAAGTACALIGAILFTLSRAARSTIMPTAMVLRSVPLVALTPLIAVVFGRDILSVTIVAGLITFFPTLVNVSIALRSATPEAIDLCHGFGGSTWARLIKIQVPTALPALFGSLRVVAPLSLVGALVAERLISGTGLGYLMDVSAATYDFDQLWSAVVLVTVYSMTLYLGISLIETAVRRRFGQPA
jgi:ABC-type nitrate/sulfonate/bicarbonate transport system permease component